MRLGDRFTERELNEMLDKCDQIEDSPIAIEYVLKNIPSSTYGTEYRLNPIYRGQGKPEGQTFAWWNGCKLVYRFIDELDENSCYIWYDRETFLAFGRNPNLRLLR